MISQTEAIKQSVDQLIASVEDYKRNADSTVVVSEGAEDIGELLTLFVSNYYTEFLIVLNVQLMEKLGIDTLFNLRGVIPEFVVTEELYEALKQHPVDPSPCFDMLKNRNFLACLMKQLLPYVNGIDKKILQDTIDAMSFRIIHFVNGGLK